MDRPIIYSEEQARGYDISQGWRDAFIALGEAASDLLGNSVTVGSAQTVVAGCIATQTSPASLSILIGAGGIYQRTICDPSPEGDLPADGATRNMQGQTGGATVTLSTSALAAGQSQWALVQATFAFSDVVRSGDPSGGVLPFYNAANPTSPLQGQGGSGAVLNTEHQATITFSVVYGTPATTGSQVPPSASSGNVGLYLILLTYGQTTITTAEILTAGPSVGTGVPSNYPVAPFLAGLLAQHHLGIPGQAPQIDLIKEVKNILPFANLPSSVVSFPQTSAEVSAGVVPVNYNIPSHAIVGSVIVDRYGTNTTPGTTAMDTAIANAIAVAKATNAGASVVQFLAAQYLCAAAVNISSASGITLRGVGNLTGGGGAGTLITSSLNTSASFVNAQGSHGCTVERMQITNTTSGYTGILLDFTATASAGYISDLLLTVGSGASHLALDKITSFKAENVQFDGGSKSVQGQAHAGGSYAQVVEFSHCNWYGSVNAPVNDGGQCWKFDHCFFEALSGGGAGAYLGAVGSAGMVFQNCWFGDETVAGTWLTFTNATGLSICGCVFEGGGTTSTAISLSNSFGFDICANEIYNIGTFVNFAGATCRGGAVQHNDIESVTTAFAGITNCDTTVELNPNNPFATSTPTFLNTTTGYEISANGLIRQWGNVLVSESGGSGSSAITFQKPLGTSIYSIKLSVNAACNVFYSSSSLTGMTVNITNASAGVTVFWEVGGI